MKDLSEYDSIVDENWVEGCIDDTLPPNHVKFLRGDQAIVYRVDLETEHAVPVASWPERATKRAQKR